MAKAADKPKFFDNYQDLGGGGTYMAAPEKNVLIDQGIPFTIDKLAFEAEGPFDGKPRFVAFVTVPDPDTGETEERQISYTKNSGAESRDKMLAAMQEYLDGGGDPVKVKMYRAGRAILLEAAE
jgi:hypothetical protein